MIVSFNLKKLYSPTYDHPTIHLCSKSMFNKLKPSSYWLVNLSSFFGSIQETCLETIIIFAVQFGGVNSTLTH